MPRVTLRDTHLAVCATWFRLEVNSDSTIAWWGLRCPHIITTAAAILLSFAFICLCHCWCIAFKPSGGVLRASAVTALIFLAVLMGGRQLSM
jgi:hypothetical protein